ncbi:MAG: histidinol phosphate phosphatase domain-containing protein [Desulfuromonadales bacterium]|nr:histidinol phosphate phosphatase domain-containing protein [Desulfuromonadales bacterium]
MIDLHTHTLFSDGELIPSELARRAAVKGYTAMAMTDHGDLSNMDLIIPRLVRVAESLSREWGIRVIPGIEVTHVPPANYEEAVSEARRLGALIVIAHGETIVEPVAEGTNRAAINARVDILAHPGLISEEDTMLAAKMGVLLELTSRKGHSLTNGHVASMAKKHGAELVINNDAHAPSDLISFDQAEKIVRGAGLSSLEFERAQANAAALIEKVLAKNR